MCVFTAAPTVIWGKSRAMHLPAKRHFLAITRVTTVEGQGFARMLRVPPRPTITQVKTIEKLNQDLGTDYPVPFTDKESVHRVSEASFERPPRLRSSDRVMLVPAPVSVA